MNTTIQPIHPHDCDRCIFLGQHHDNIGAFDLYLCPQLPGIPTLVARFGQYGDYTTSLHSSVPALQVAREMAERRGLL